MSSSVSPPDTPIIHSDGLFDLNTPPYRVLIDNDVKNMDVMLELEPSLKLTVQECLLNPDRLTLGDVIGQGIWTFVDIYILIYHPIVYHAAEFVLFFFIH